MTANERLRKTRFPLALPVIFAGTRTSIVINVGTAYLAFFIGGGLGEWVVSGINLFDMPQMVAGAVPGALSPSDSTHARRDPVPPRERRPRDDPDSRLSRWIPRGLTAVLMKRSEHPHATRSSRTERRTGRGDSRVVPSCRRNLPVVRRTRVPGAVVCCRSPDPKLYMAILHLGARLWGTRTNASRALVSTRTGGRPPVAGYFGSVRLPEADNEQYIVKEPTPPVTPPAGSYGRSTDTVQSPYPPISERRFVTDTAV